MDNEGDVVTTEVEITTYDDETDNVHDQNIQIEVAPPKRVHRVSGINFFVTKKM